MSSTAHEDTLDLVEREIPRLRRYARYLARDPDYADDLVQECLLRAIQKLDSWTPGTNMRAWLLVILQNVFRNDLRKANREVSASNFSEEQLTIAVPGAQEAHMAFLEVRTAFLDLSEDHREVLLLVAVEGMSYEEAAVILDVPVGTVRSRLSRAREALRAAVDGADVEPLEPAQESRGG